MRVAGRKTGLYVPKFGPEGDWHRREHELAAIARRQHGVISLTQLRALGFSDSGVRKRVAHRRLHRVHNGVFALGRPDLPKHGRWMAAVLACGEGALLSHRASTALHELLSVGGGPIDVTVPNRSARSRRGIRIHRPVALHPSERAVVEGIPLHLRAENTAGSGRGR